MFIYQSSKENQRDMILNIHPQIKKEDKRTRVLLYKFDTTHNLKDYLYMFCKLNRIL